MDNDKKHEVSALVHLKDRGLTKRSSALVRRALESPLTQRAMSNYIGMEFVRVPAGEFLMGSIDGYSNEKPVHRVTIGQSFFMGKYEVTQTQWQKVMCANPSHFKGDDLPVEHVSWNDTQDFMDKLNEMNDGYKYRLPTEAEWEYACRAGTTGDHYAPDLDNIGWWTRNSGQKTHRVGSKQPNAYGLYDMLGNVYEWCHDWYVDTYEGAPANGSARLLRGELKQRICRGGSWYNISSGLCSSSRFCGPLNNRDSVVGFRLVAVVRTP